MDEIRQTTGDIPTLYVLDERGSADQDEKDRILRYEQKFKDNPTRTPWNILGNRISKKLVSMGVNPAGPRKSWEKSGQEDWWRLFEPPNDEWQPVDEATRAEGKPRYLRQLLIFMAASVFDRAGRDFESIGLGVLTPPKSLKLGISTSELVAEQVIASSIRILGLAGKFAGCEVLNIRSSRTHGIPRRLLSKKLCQVLDFVWFVKSHSVRTPNFVALNVQKSFFHLKRNNINSHLDFDGVLN